MKNHFSIFVPSFYQIFDACVLYLEVSGIYTEHCTSVVCGPSLNGLILLCGCNDDLSLALSYCVHFSC